MINWEICNHSNYLGNLALFLEYYYQTQILNSQIMLLKKKIIYLFIFFL